MTYAICLVAALSVFAVWLYYRARHNHHCEKATERLRDALKGNADTTVRALLIADRKWLSAQQARDAEHFLFCLDEKREEHKTEDGFHWTPFAEREPTQQIEYLVSRAGRNVSAKKLYPTLRDWEKEGWTHWAEMPMCAR